MKNFLFAAGTRLCAPPPIKGFTAEDRMIFGLLPTWAFLLILAGITMAAIVVIVETVKRRNGGEENACTKKKKTKAKKKDKKQK